MADQPHHTFREAVKPSLAAAQRARRILRHATVSNPTQLNAFALGAGLLAGMLIKRTKPRSRK